MRRVTAILILSGALVACSVAVPSAATAGRLGHACRPGGSRVLARDRQVVLYAVGDGSGGIDLRACLRDGESRDLGDFDGIYTGLSRAALDGTVAAIAWSECLPDYGPCGDYVSVMGVRSGKVLYDVADGPDVESNGYGAYSGDGRISSLVVTRDGATAWIASNPRWSVYTFGAGGYRRIASGSSVAPHSLRLAGSQISWLQSNTRQYAVLPEG